MLETHAETVKTNIMYCIVCLPQLSNVGNQNKVNWLCVTFVACHSPSLSTLFPVISHISKYVTYRIYTNKNCPQNTIIVYWTFNVSQLMLAGCIRRGWGPEVAAATTDDQSKTKRKSTFYFGIMSFKKIIYDCFLIDWFDELIV